MSVQGLRILVVEDEEDIGTLIRSELERDGFVVSLATNGLDAWQRIERGAPAAVILDLMLPGMSGLELCKRIKQQHAIPVLMVTARTSETDAIVGLELGADDYIRKPFSPRELVARLRTVLRRQLSGREAEAGQLVVGKIEMDLSAHQVRVDGKDIELSALEFKILRLLLENPNIAFSRERLLDRVWGREVYVSDRTVDVNIKRLRDRLGEEQNRLETIRGVGYRLRRERAEEK